MWLLFSILTGLLFGFQSVLVKSVSKQYDQIHILKYLFLIAGIILLPIALINIPKIDYQSFSIAFLLSLIINIFAYLLFFTAIKRSPISLVMPYVGFTPLFLTVTGYLILGEKVNQFQVIGIIFILFGGFILQIPKSFKLDQKGIKFKDVFNREEKGIYIVLLVSFLWSFTASIEKIAIQSSSPEFFWAFINLILGVCFYILGKFFSEKFNQTKSIIKKSGKYFYILIFIGIVSAGLVLSQYFAIKITAVSTVIAYKRAGVIVSSIVGLFILKEGNILKTITGTIIILAGATIIGYYNP